MAFAARPAVRTCSVDRRSEATLCCEKYFTMISRILIEPKTILLATLLSIGCCAAPRAAAQQVSAYRVSGDSIVEPLTAQPGDPARGREVVIGREAGNCTLCHALPGVPNAGTIGPPLAGVGARLSAGQLRLRLADATRINSSTAMPAYYRLDAPRDVAPAYRGRTVLEAQQIEDAIAYLKSLQ